MSEPPTPSKGQTKRRGLALPPRGQALARLQDLEQDLERDTQPEAVATGTVDAENVDAEQPANEVINAVNTASSNAVNHHGSNAVLSDGNQEQNAAPPVHAVLAASQQDPSLQNLPAGAAPGLRHNTPVRAAREPTTRITVDMPDSLHRKISFLSVETRRSIKDLVIEALAATYFGTDENSE